VVKVDVHPTNIGGAWRGEKIELDRLPCRVRHGRVGIIAHGGKVQFAGLRRVHGGVRSNQKLQPWKG